MGEWAGKLLEWMVGSAAEAIGVNLDHVKKQALARAGDFNPFRQEISANHDLTRAVRMSWIEAASWVAKEAMRLAAQPEWRSARDEVERFDAVLRRVLVALRHAGFDRQAHPGESAIDDSLQAVLHGVPEFIGGGTEPLPGRVLTERFEATLAALTGWHRAEIPALFGQVARHGLPVNGNGPLRDFGELVFADFAETIKDPERYPQAARAFHVAMASMARTLAQATLDAVRGLDARLDAALPRLDALALMQRALAQQMAQVEARLGAVQVAVDAVPEATVNLLMRRLQAGGLIDSARHAGVEEMTVIALARRLSAGEVRNLDQAVREIERAVEIAAEVIARGVAGLAGQGHDAFVVDVLQRVARQTGAGQIDEGAASVDDALAELERIEAEQQAARDRARRALLEAGLQQDLLRRDPAAAARRLLALAALATPGGASRPAWTPAFLDRQQALQQEGETGGVNLSLEVAVEMARRMLDSAARPDERIEALVRLGAALTPIGEREHGTRALDEALSVQETIADEAGRDVRPVIWAAAQHERGRVLGMLGERQGRAWQLEDALAAFEQSLGVRSRHERPAEWAATQDCLGHVLRLLGMRGNDRRRLVAAVDAFRASLRVRTRTAAPLEWGRTQANLGIALTCLGRLEGDAGKQAQAADAYRDALKEVRRDRLPLEWGRIQNALGIALAALGERLGADGAAALRDSAAAFREASSERTRDKMPVAWASQQHNLGGTLHWLGLLETGCESLEQAAAAFREALLELGRDDVPLYWGATQCDLGAVLLTWGVRRGDTALIEEAAACQRAGLLERTRDRVPLDWAYSNFRLGQALHRMAEREAGTGRLEEAVAAYRAALTVYAADAEPDLWRKVTAALPEALTLLEARRGRQLTVGNA